MNLRHVVSLAALCVVTLTGCDGGRTAPGKVSVRVANAAPGFASLTFQRERPPSITQQTGTTLGFKNTTSASYDADTYDFYIDERSLAANHAGRSWTFERQLEVNTEYLFVLTESGSEVTPVVVEYANPASADAQIVAVHAGALPAVDLYLVAPGMGIGGAAPRGTLAVGGSFGAQTLPPGEYELWLTAAGNPADVLFTSATIALVAAETTAIVVVPESGLGTATLSVMFMQTATTSVLYDRSATAELRVINGAADGQPRDFAVNGEFAPPLFSAVPFGEATAYAPVPVAGGQPINVTPAGNPGVLEIEQTLTTVAGVRATVLFAGATGSLLHVAMGDDGRRLVNEAKVRLLNAANQFTALDFLLLDPGADPSNFAGDAALATPGFSDYAPRAPGEYDLYLRQTGTIDTMVFGPQRVTLAAGGLYGVLAINGPDTTTANVVLLDDFP